MSALRVHHFHLAKKTRFVNILLESHWKIEAHFVLKPAGR